MQRLEGTNTPHIAGGPFASCFLGARVALVVDDGVPAPLRALLASEPAAVAALVRDLERLLGSFDRVVGRRPPVLHGLEGRVRVEVAFLQGAAGLAHHGQAGFAVGPAFLEQCVRSRCAGLGPPLLSHIFCYECCRNYIFPEDFTAVLDYSCVRGAVTQRGALGVIDPLCSGWVNQGLVNVLGVLLTLDDAAEDVRVDYHGQSADQFLAGMEQALDRHICDQSLSWSDTFMHERLPWAHHHSLDNVYSGILVRLWRLHGRSDFLRRFFTLALPLLLANGRAPASKLDAEVARENFLLACSVAARLDLAAFFERDLRMPLRAAAAEGVLPALLALADC